LDWEVRRRRDARDPDVPGAVDRDAPGLVLPGPAEVARLQERRPAGIEEGDYSAKSLNPRNGKTSDLGRVKGPRWKSPPVSDEEDWAFLLVRS